MANSLNIDLTDKRVIVKDGLYRVGPTEADRTFLCKDGYGCHSFTSGRAIHGQFVNHPELGDIRIEGYEIEKLADDEETGAYSHVRCLENRENGHEDDDE